MNKEKITIVGDIREYIGHEKIEKQNLYYDNKENKPLFYIKGEGDSYRYVPYAKQLIFHKSHILAFETLYGGAAGGGKSWSLVMDAYMTAIRYPGCRILIVRRTYPELEKSLIQYTKSIFTAKDGEYNETKKKWKIYTPVANKPSYIEFGHCKTESDVYRYQSAQYDALYFDELTHFTEFQYTYLLTRLRPNVANLKPFVKSATNPGNIGHGWVKRRFHIDDRSNDYLVFRVEQDQQIQEVLNILGLKSPTRVFIPATVYDNLELIKKDKNYVARLLTSKYKKQLLDGDWGIFAGQAFPEFDKKVHTMNSSNYTTPANLKRIICQDFGYSKPSAIYLLEYDISREICYVVHEMYMTKVADFEQGKRIAELNNRYPSEYLVIDPSTFAKRSSPKSIADNIAEALNYILPIRPGNNDRYAGKNKIHDYLSIGSDGTPHLIILADRCPKLVECLSEIVVDDKNIEDVDTTQEEHAYDALRYGLMELPTIKDNKIIKLEVQSNSRLDEASRREWESVAKKYFNKEKTMTKISEVFEGYN